MATKGSHSTSDPAGVIDECGIVTTRSPARVVTARSTNTGLCQGTSGQIDR